MKATITSLIFLLLSLTVSSQTYKYIGIEEGLSNQKIYKIQKDARGYMWFLTHVGIDQYNGKEIKHYKLREGNRELDPLLNINWTFLDKTGTLLVTGKQGRIFRYDSGHDRFVQIYNMYNYWNKDYHAFVRYSYIDQEDNVWPVSYTHLDVYKRQMCCCAEVQQYVNKSARQCVSTTAHQYVINILLLLPCKLQLYHFYKFFLFYIHSNNL